ncbi:hypothetical protein MNEG_16392, partial [Monoraphidium neglectum]
MAYGLALMPFAYPDLTVMSSVLTSATKQAVRLTTAAPNLLIQNARAAGGLGCHSLAVEAATQAAERTITCLNDKGRIGRITRALLRAQLELHNGTATDVVGPSNNRPSWLHQYSMGLRRLEIARQTGLFLANDACDFKTKQLSQQLKAWLTRLGGAPAAKPTALKAITDALAPDLMK